jgi:preprotein translocase subunit SecE
MSGLNTGVRHVSKAVAEVKQDNRLVRYFKETRAELRKVHWPTRKEARNLTLIVLATTIAMTILLGVLDFVFSWFSEGVFVNSDPIRLIILIVLAAGGLVALVIAMRRQ